MNIIRLADLSDEGLAPYVRLTERQLQNRLHPTEGLMVCESMKVIRIALQQGMEAMSMLCEEKFLPTLPAVDVPVYVGSRALLQQLTGYELSRGVLCAMRRPALPTPEEVLRGARRVAVLDGVVNSENTGAIFRAAAALGMDAVLLTHTCCDPLNRRACRVSMGTVFQLPWTMIDDYSALRQSGFTTVAMALEERSVPLHELQVGRDERVAVVLGAEGDGLSSTALEQCTHVVRIPMQRGVDSLNVAAAAAVVFYALAMPTPPPAQR